MNIKTKQYRLKISIIDKVYMNKIVFRIAGIMHPLLVLTRIFVKTPIFPESIKYNLQETTNFTHIMNKITAYRIYQFF